jgi:hypothetical protein
LNDTDDIAIATNRDVPSAIVDVRLLTALTENMIELPVEWRKALRLPAAKVSVSEANTSVNKVYTLEA